MATATIVLPGDTIPSTLIPTTKKALKLGPGLRHIPPSTLKASIAGSVTSDQKKNAIWIDYTNLNGGNGGRYMPTAGDLVIATIGRSMGEYYAATLSPHTPSVILPQLAFEGASKKTRPQLSNGDLVYARVLTANRHVEVEIQCFNENTGKGEGMGPLKGGMLYDISCTFARRLMLGKKGGVVVLEDLSERCAFEVAVGRNGKVWVQAENVKVVIAVGRALVATDEEGLDVQQQKEIVKKLLKGL